MNIIAKYIRPENYEIEITITMRSEEWLEVTKSLPIKHPFYQLSTSIKTVLERLIVPIYGSKEIK